MHKLEAQLKDALDGEVRFDKTSRTVYAVDASIYEVQPIGVVLPRSSEDVVRAVEIAAAHAVPIIARGAATGIVGGCIGKGLVIDTSRYLTKILEVDAEHNFAIVEPGVVQDDLNKAVAQHGLCLGPNTSTGNRATIGGMVGNNSAGSHSLRYGQMVDHVEEVDLVVASGATVTLSPVHSETWHGMRQLPGDEGRIYRELYRIRHDYADAIAKQFPDVPRQVSGYNLDRLVGELPYNPASMVVGAEGSLGIATRIKVSLSPKPNYVGLAVLHFHDLIETMAAVPAVLEHNPSALELIDEHIIKLGRQAPPLRGRLGWLHGDPKALLVVEFDGRTASDVQDKIDAFTGAMESQAIGYSHSVETSPQAMDNVWAMRKSGLGILLSKRSFSRAVAFIEDIVVPPEALPEVIGGFRSYLNDLGKEAGFYGHIGAGAVHVRPWVNMREKEDLHLMKEMLVHVGELVKAHGGSLSAEHGDGFCRSWMNEAMFGSELYQAFKEVKAAFDPRSLMNPGKVIATEEFLDNLRANDKTKLQKIDTFLDFSKEGGFELAADLCNGNAACRKREGVMCPSFQASGDEYHTTRARAQSLRAIINGRRHKDAFTDRDLYKVMALCIECKGCKTECPSQVDMAKMKSEFLYQYHRVHGTPFRDRLFGHVARLNKLMSPFAWIINAMSETRIGKWQQRLFGIAPERRLPPLALQRFSQWWKKHPKRTEGRPVVLFIDTFTEFNTPEIGIAAVKVLEALGCRVIAPKVSCCGRPMLSKGLLASAKRHALSVVDQLQGYVDDGAHVVGLEPSCILTIRDDYTSLTPNAQKVADHCVTFDEFVAEHLENGELPCDMRRTQAPVVVHGHCHQKSLVGMEPTQRILDAIAPGRYQILPSGCCGMAGSFGYEAEHYAFSQKIGEATLFPHLRAVDQEATVIASGTSCRTQIKDATGQEAVHLAQWLASHLY